MKTLSLYKIKAGTWVSGTIKNTQFTGKVQIEDGRVYICQNEQDGSDCNNKLGFKYSWVVDLGKVEDLKNNNVVIKTIYKSKPKNFKFVPIRKWVIGDYTATEVKNGIKVGCTFVPDSLIKKIAKARKLI